MLLAKQKTGDPKLFTFFELQSDAAGQDDESPVWVQVALEGDFQGYNPPFKLDLSIFQQMVANIHKHPSFKRGSNGKGMADVYQWDFEHASENDGDTVAQLGTPAQGWVQDLEVRYTADGKAQLWALTRWLELARDYIKEGKYKWASIAYYDNVRDPVSGVGQGATITSIAMTNHPFIEGMEPLAAKKGQASVQASYWDAADNAEEALRKIKRELQLPETSEMTVVTGELAKIRQWISTGTVPFGVMIGEVLAAFRQILNLPVLSTEVEVLDEADKLVSRIIQEQAIQSQPAAMPAIGSENNQAMVAGGKQMNELLKALARLLGVREDADENVIKTAVGELVELRNGVKKALAADKDTTKVLLEAAEEIVSLRKKGDESLVALKEALGTKATEDPTARIAALLKAEKELGELKPKYEELAKVAEDQENAKAEEDVTRALQAHGLPENAKAALLARRKSNPEEFAKEFPVAAPEHEQLTQVLVTNTRPNQQQNPQTPPQGNVIDLSQYYGRNDTERRESFILATVPGSDKWPRDKMFAEVNRMRLAQEGGR